MRGGTILCRGNAGHYCATGYRGEKKGMQGGKVEVFGNPGDFCAEYLACGEVHIHGSTGDFPGVEMRGGQLIIEGDTTRPCANMKDGTCVILGRVYEMIPTFEKTDRREVPEWKITADVYGSDFPFRNLPSVCFLKCGNHFIHPAKDHTGAVLHVCTGPGRVSFNNQLPTTHFHTGKIAGAAMNMHLAC